MEFLRSASKFLQHGAYGITLDDNRIWFAICLGRNRSVSNGWVESIYAGTGWDHSGRSAIGQLCEYSSARIPDSADQHGFGKRSAYRPLKRLCHIGGHAEAGRRWRHSG
jgi:hypothetical protein